MALDLLAAVAQDVVVTPRERMASPSASWLTPAGVESALTSTLDPTSSSVVSSSRSTTTLASAASVVVGRTLLLTETGQPDRYAVVASVDGAAVTWAEPLDRAPEAGASVLGVAVTVSLTAANTATRGVGYRIRLVDGHQEHVEWCSVVRHLFDAPATAADVREYLGRIAPSASRDAAWDASMADRACSLVRTQLDQQGLRPDLFGDSSAFREAGRLALRYLIARDDGIYPPHTQDPEGWLRDADGAWRSAVGEATASLASYDSQDTGGTADETERRVGLIRLRRSS